MGNPKTQTLFETCLQSIAIAYFAYCQSLHPGYVDTGPWSLDMDDSRVLTVPIVALLVAALVLFLRGLERWYQRRHGSSLPPGTDLITLAGFALLLVAVLAIEAHFLEWAGVWKQ
jgi:hypothetical protein